MTEPAQKKKRVVSYRKEWESTYPWVTKSSESAEKAYCVVCSKHINITHGGANDLKVHAAGKGHTTSQKDANSNRALSTYFLPDVPKKLLIAEATLVYHNVMHNLSYNSLDCSIKLLRTLFKDSPTAKGLRCGKTKAEAIVTGVLAPCSVTNGLQRILEKKLPYSVSSDASNKGSMKYFPLLLQYYDGEIFKLLLDFYEDHQEDAESISQAILSRLDNAGLSTENISAYCADNANVNYGKHKSVFVLLKEKAPDMVKANCHAHIIHNCLKHATEELTEVDIESVITRTYNHFSCQSKRTAELKTFYEFVELDWKELIRHVATR